MRTFRPAYSYLSRDELAARVGRALATLEDCRACPRDCGVNRLEDKWAACKTGRYAVVGSHFPHFGEEDCLRGWNGSGTIFFSHCNLRCVFCCGPDTRVATEDGPARIEDLFLQAERTDDRHVRRPSSALRLFSREGQSVEVAKLFRHRHRGEILRLKPYSCPPLLVTPNHRMFVVSKSDPTRVFKKRADELKRDHRLLVPRLRPRPESVELEIPHLLSGVVAYRKVNARTVPGDELVTLFSQRWTSRTLAQITGYHPAYVRKLRGEWIRGDFELLARGSTVPIGIVEEGGTVRFETEKRPGIPARLNLNEDLAWLLGLYCAEGHVTSPKNRPNSHSLVFSFAHGERERAKRVQELIDELFGATTELRRRRTTFTVETGKASLALFFRELCGGGAAGKRVPPCLFRAPGEVIRAFLDGVAAGDGWDGPSHVVINTVSERFAHGLFHLGTRLGMLPSYHLWEPPEEKVIEGRRVRQRPLHYVKFPKINPRTGERRTRWKEAHGGWLVPIHKLDRVPYDGPVYNLEVDDADHSYLASSVAVANCQNWDISQAIKPHKAPPGSAPDEIADMMLELQAKGCHNINFVTPEHVVPQVIEALAAAVERGLELPIVYNTSAYDALESLELMDGLVDIYMPDFKFWSGERSATYMKARDYPGAARAAIREMHRQVGNLVTGADGLAKRGLILRHLVMPGMLDETERILEWVARELGPDTYVNLMDQYYPAGSVEEGRHPEIGRRLGSEEFRKAREIADRLGLRKLDERRPHPRLARRMLATGR